MSNMFEVRAVYTLLTPQLQFIDHYPFRATYNNPSEQFADPSKKPTELSEQSTDHSVQFTDPSEQSKLSPHNNVPLLANQSIVLIPQSCLLSYYTPRNSLLTPEQRSILLY